MSNRRLGYEYRYRFGKDDKSISDDIISWYKFDLSSGFNVFLFDIRTNFILKKRVSVDDNNNNDDDDDDEIVMCFECFNARVDYEDDEWFLLTLHSQTSFRLEEYWMPLDEIQKFVHGALDFAKQQLLELNAGAQSSSSIARVIRLIVGVDVCTVQQEGEELEAAMDRAIRADFLFPIHLWNYSRREYRIDFVNFLVDLPRIRVEDVDEGLGLMEICPICLNNPTIGAQICLVPSCRHAFHYYCIVTWLLKKRSCPLCRLQVHDFPIPIRKIQLS